MILLSIGRSVSDLKVHLVIEAQETPKKNLEIARFLHVLDSRATHIKSRKVVNLRLSVHKKASL